MHYQIQRDTLRIEATLGHNNQVHAPRHLILIQAKKFSENTLGPVSTDSVSHLATHGEPVAPHWRGALTFKGEHDEMLGKVTAACIVAGYIVRPPCQTIGSSQHYADSLALPLALLRRRIARPLGLLERARNP